MKSFEGEKKLGQVKTNPVWRGLGIGQGSGAVGALVADEEAAAGARAPPLLPPPPAARRERLRIKGHEGLGDWNPPPSTLTWH